MKRIAFVVPNWNEYNVTLGVDTARPPVSTPLEFAYLTDLLKQHTIISLIDCYLNNINIKRLKEELLKFNPDYIIINTTPNLLYWRCPPTDLSLLKRTICYLRRYLNSQFIVFGPHCEISPSWVRKKLKVEHVISGFFINEIKNIILPNYKFEQTFLADFDLFDRYPSHYWAQEILNEKHLIPSNGILLETSSGCPFNCAYCLKTNSRNNFIRRDFAIVKKEIEAASNIGIEYIFFIDETFNFKDASYNKILNLLKSFNIKFGFQARADIITEKDVVQLADCGCIYIEFGMDIYEENNLSSIRKQDIKKAWDIIQFAKSKIKVVRYNRLFISTYDYVKLGFSYNNNKWENIPDPIIPYPGTEIGTQLLKLYNVHETKIWEFVEKYYWWLRIEVYLLRKKTDLGILTPFIIKLYLNLPRNILIKLNSLICKAVMNNIYINSNLTYLK
jgi:anaerobic magnesium-protoporphyrin IX monomethyl ester cyclase